MKRPAKRQMERVRAVAVLGIDQGGTALLTPGSSRLTGGDVDADWRRADASGDEAVGGSTATPDQDVVDELGEAIGVGQASDAEVVTSGEILSARDRHRWHLERDAALREEAASVAEEEGRS